MELLARPSVTAGVALTAASLIAVTPVTPTLAHVELPDIQLASVADTLGADLATLVAAPDLAPPIPMEPPASWLYDLSVAETGFNEFLQNSEIGFNTNLVTAEINLEELIFGTDSALNGTLNRLYNVGNMFVDTIENVTNGTLFGNNADITASLTVGLNGMGDLLPNLFNSGALGGLEGIFNNLIAAFFDFLGIFVQ